MFSELVKDIFLGAVRHFATFGGGYLMAHGIITCTQADLSMNACSQLNDWIGSVCFFGGLAWSAYEKYNRKP